MSKEGQQQPDGELIKLGIAMGYPVEWDIEKCIRDLIQNFYDAIGAADFARDFVYSYGSDKDGGLFVGMSTAGHPFAYEWLCYMGSSTKTGQEGFVGQYGEGFKVAALCLLRMGCRMKMESQDWRLVPCTYTQKVDGVDVEMLGYRVTKRKDNGKTSLRATGISSGWRRKLKEAPLHFYAPGSGLIGRVLYEGDGYAICERSEMPMPQRFADVIGNGVLYYRYLARGELPFPLVICVKMSCVLANTNRERDTFAECQVPSIIYEVAREMDAAVSLFLLEEMKKWWSDLPDFHGEDYADTETWYYVICQLVRNIAKDENTAAKFMAAHDGELVQCARESSDNQKNKQIRAAKKWHRNAGDKRRIVNPVFRLLGVPDLLQEYEAYILATEFDKPQDTEARMADLLRRVFEAIAPDCYLVGDAPEVLLCGDFQGDPAIFCRRIQAEKIPGKMRQKYEVKAVILSPAYFDGRRFLDAFISYAGQRFRVFGLDGSEIMAALLTQLGATLYRGREIVAAAWKKWEELAEEAEKERGENDDD